MIDTVTDDDPTPEQLEQLARSVAIRSPASRRATPTTRSSGAATARKLETRCCLQNAERAARPLGLLRRVSPPVSDGM
jgi:hypothetical protein